MYSLLRYIPKNHLSFLVGKLAEIPVPHFMRRFVIGTFANLAGASLSEAGKELTEYASVADFFTRELKPGLRPIHGPISCPVDGTLRSVDRIDSDTLVQAKGRTYSLNALLGEDGSQFIGGTVFNLYLSPKDYHRVHFPVSGRVERSNYIAGNLWPVNDWALHNIDSLFSVNERVVTWISTPQGQVALVMVGACNVGKISLGYAAPAEVKAGDHLGTFHLGSTVILFFQKGIQFGAATVGQVRMGQRL